MFGVSVIELALVALALVVAAALLLLRVRGAKWAVAAMFGLIVATLITPADLLSTLVVGAAFVGFFAAGTRITYDGSSQRSPKPSESAS